MKQIKALLQHNRNTSESSRQSSSRAASPVDTPSPSRTQTANLAAEVPPPVKVDQIPPAPVPASQPDTVGTAGLVPDLSLNFNHFCIIVVGFWWTVNAWVTCEQ